MKVVDKVFYLQRSIFPVKIGFTMSEKAYTKEIKRINVQGAYPFIHTSLAHGCVHMLENPESGRLCIMTLCPKAMRQMNITQKAGIIAHESMHIVRYVEQSIGESRFSDETEAYFLHYLVQEILYIVLNSKMSVRQK